jgi:hemoglobin
MSSFPAAPDAFSVSRAVPIFLDRLLADERVAWAFEGFDYDRVNRHTRAFLIAALGGPDLYLGRDMRAVHTPLHLRDEHFDIAVEHLVASLVEVGTAESLASALAARLEPLRSQIVSA